MRWGSYSSTSATFESTDAYRRRSMSNSRSEYKSLQTTSFARVSCLKTLSIGVRSNSRRGCEPLFKSGELGYPSCEPRSRKWTTR